MKMPRKKYDFESRMLYAFSCGLETGLKLSGLTVDKCEDEIKESKRTIL